MKSLFICVLLVIASLVSFANIETYYMSSSFNSPEGSYVEYYFVTIGNSIKYTKNENGNYQGEIEVSMIFKIKDSIACVNKYNLTSPEIDEEKYENENFPNFVDVQRVALDQAIYTVEIRIEDKNNLENAVSFTDNLHVDFPDDRVTFSDFEFLEKVEKSNTETIITKSNYDLLPYVSDYFPKNMSKLSFYLEIYNSDKYIKDDFLFTYYVEKFESATAVPGLGGIKKLKPANVNAIIAELNIEELYSGNYLLVAEIRNRNNDILLKTKQFFQRNNPNEKLMRDLEELAKDMDINRTFDGELNNIDSIREYVSCLHPIANIDERAFINVKVKKMNIDELQAFFVSFWLKRNVNTPGEDWREYKRQVEFINKHYGSRLNKGYASERGRVYLQYGAPNDVYSSLHEPSAYPYEIWTYHRVANENNRKFIFYNRNIAGNEYELLHSDLTGEIKTPNWEVVLHKRTDAEGSYEYNNPDVNESWGSRAKREYKTK